MTLTTDRPAVLPPVEKVHEPEVQPAPRPPRKPVRWLGWTLGLLIVAVGATFAVMALTAGESFEELYEAESELVLGAIHEPGYVAPVRWVGESDMTLEEFEAMTMDNWVTEYIYQSTFDTFETLYEAESGLVLGPIHMPGYEAPQRWIGESDGTLEEFEAGHQSNASDANLPDHLTR